MTRELRVDRRFRQRLQRSDRPIRLELDAASSPACVERLELERLHSRLLGARVADPRGSCARRAARARATATGTASRSTATAPGPPAKPRLKASLSTARRKVASTIAPRPVAASARARSPSSS